MNVYILLDRSGSMSGLWTEAINSINSYVEGLKKTDKVHLSVFDHSYETVRDVKVKDWTPLDEKEVQPRGMTALYDSCGKIMSQAEMDNAKKTILVVMTDGHENSSKEYSQITIKQKVKQFEDRKWEVIFLGANFDAVDSVSGSFGVVASKSMNIAAGNMFDAMSTLRSYTQSYSTTGASINFSDEDKILASTKVNTK